MNAAVEISKLEIGYPTHKGDAIKVAGPIDISIGEGEMICLVGPNGVGKTTLLRTMAGIQPSLKGFISILNHHISAISKKKLARFLSVVLTDRIISGNLTAYELISLGRIPYTGWFGNLGKADKTKIRWAIDNAAVQHLAHKSIHELSDGERQKVMVTRALAQDTPVILLDEPTAHLDLPNRVDIVRLLRKLARETNKTIIMSTHELDLALQAADKIWLMTLDNHTYSGAPEDLVLSDIFSRTFTKEGITFDIEHGVFKVIEPYTAEIRVSGDEIGIFWTKRALERYGYKATSSHKIQERVFVRLHEHHWSWEYDDGNANMKFASIEELTTYLKLKGGDL